MPYLNPLFHFRRSCRLKGYDYSKKGYYFVTICCQNFDFLFGAIIDGEMIPNEAGIMVANSWMALPNRFENIKLHEFVVMPNHFHGIIEITAPSQISINSTGGSTLVVGHAQISNQFNNQNDIGVRTETGQPQGLPGQLNNQELVKNRNTTIGNMMDAFKSITTVEYIHGVKTLKWKPFYKKVW
jgi:REP element-mobilizing transposase RayT